MVDGSLGKQIPVGEISVELAMPGNLTKDLGHEGTGAPDFAAVLQGSLKNGEGMGANSLPPIHQPLTHDKDSLSDSLSASLAVALSGVGVTAEPLRQLQASDPQTEGIAAIPVNAQQPLGHTETAAPFPMSTGPAGGEARPAASIPTAQPPAPDPRAESITAIPANALRQLGHAETAVSPPMPTVPVGDETHPVFSTRTPQSFAPNPRTESFAAIPANARQPLGHAETMASFPISTSPIGDEVDPAFSVHSICQPSLDATGSTRLDPISLPLQPSSEIQPALTETHSAEPANHTANPSDTLPRKAEFAWSVQNKTDNNSPRTAVPSQFTGVNTASKESAQGATQPKTESRQWITFTTEKAQADAPAASSAMSILQRTKQTVAPPDTKGEGSPAPTLPPPSAMRIPVHLEPSALPAHSPQLTATQSGPRESAVSSRFPEPKPMTPAAEPMAAEPQINQRISQGASANASVGTAQLPQSNDSLDAPLAVMPALTPALSETPQNTPLSAETGTAQKIGVQPAASLAPNIPVPGSAAGPTKSNTASKTTETNSGQAPVRIQLFGRTSSSDLVSETNPVRTAPQRIPEKDSARSSNTHSQNPEKQRAAGDASSAAPHLATAERVPAAQAGAHTSADSAPDTARAGAVPAPTGKAVSVDSAVRTNAADQPAERSKPSAGLEVWNGGDNAQTRLVQSARLAAHPDRSEMRVALEGDRLGTVEVQAKVTNDQIRAAIAVDRHDTHAVLASDLSALHHALNDRQIGAAHVTLFQGSLSSNDAFGNGNLAGRREASPQANENTRWAGGESSLAVVRGAESPLQNNIFDSNGRLSVRA